MLSMQSIRHFLRPRARAIWIDDGNAQERLARMRADPSVKVAIEELMDGGVAVLRNNLDGRLIEEVLADFNAYCNRSPESGEYRDRYGLHERLCNLQLVSRSTRALALNQKVLQILRLVFEAPPLVVGSLFFEKGSQQSIHRDGPAFFTNPIGHFFGVWHALEDITEESGPLVYYQGGHRAIADEVLRARPGLNEPAYFAAVIDACESQRLPKRRMTLSKGDTLIWHPQLPHGGSAIADPKRSRKSLVFHYIPLGVPIYGPKEFFGKGTPPAKGPNYEILRLDNGYFYKHAAPKFFHNYVEGNFKEV
jgi:ectoine hydroxylase-related dioxygenase (phytanoyl-CoA dioxygenase family)